MELKGDIKKWLLQSRIRTNSAAEALGVSPQLPFVVYRMEIAGDSSVGFQPETQLLNPLRDPFTRSKVLANCKPLLDDEAVRIAKQLVSAHGPILPFFSPLSAEIVGQSLPDPAILSNGTLPENTRFALELLSKMQTEYIASVPSLDSDQPELLENLATELLAFAAGTASTTLISVPLANINLPEGVVEVGDFRLRLLEPEEAANLNMSNFKGIGSRLPGSRFSIQLPSSTICSHVLEWREQTNKLQQQGKYGNAWKSLILAFYLEDIRVAVWGMRLPGRIHSGLALEKACCR